MGPDEGLTIVRRQAITRTTRTNDLTDHCWASIALNLPVWETPSGIYGIEGPSEICTQSAEVRLAVSGAQPLFTLGLLMFALSLVDFLSLLLSPSTYFNIFLFLSKVLFELHIQNLQKISCGFKIWMGFVGPILIKLWTSSIWGFL